MVKLRKQRYIPVVRTRDAEMKGFQNLDAPILDELLPVVEFTKSRISPKNLGGSISKCVDRVLEVLGKRPFIADLCSIPTFQNSEFAGLLDPANAFENWTDWVNSMLPASCIPVVHLTEPHVHGDFVRQVSEFTVGSNTVAVRVPTSYPYIDELAKSVASLAAKGGGIILLVDANFVPPYNSNVGYLSCKAIVDAFGSTPAITSTIASCFPSSVVDKGYGADAYGKFDLSEVYISEKMKKAFPKRSFFHGDYASIHPMEVTSTITSWVPRVDVPLDTSLYYHRFRRGDGGYVRAAVAALRDASFVDLDCWGIRNIKDAATGSPQGMSPAHWISVRLNIHITRQAVRVR
jgi:hypothetical protein